MNKSVKKIAGIALGSLMLFSTVACGGGGNTGSGGGDDTPLTGAAYSRPVVFSTDMLDGTFSPFYATSGPDTQIVSLTQISMLTSEDGQLVWGEDQPTVAKEFTKTVAPDNSYTDYKFVIKQGIKFSDGVELTMRDVLFNLYVYLDPAYKGSSTMYSTDIRGLKAYRYQESALLDASEMNDSSFNRQFVNAADDRIRNILDYLDKTEDEGFDTDTIATIEKDIARVKVLFKEEVTSDWNNNVGQQESYKEEYGFNENWEIYYYVENLIKVFVPANTTKALKDVNGRYVTNITPAGTELAADTAIVQGVYEENGKKYYDGIYYDGTVVNGITEVKNNEELINAKLAELYPEASEYTQDERAFAVEEVVKDKAIDTVYSAYSVDATLSDIISYWASGSKLHEEIVAQERTAFFEGKDMEVESIIGITTNNDNDLEKATELNIRINGVDPKAEYNFSFIVAPMHYYSTPEAIQNTKFGVIWSDADFFGTEGLKSENRIGVPVGAGPYQATNSNSNDNVTKANFYANNVVYFKRNENFKTVGKELSNAKIRLLRYQVVNSDQIINSVQKGMIDIGYPNATSENLTEIGKAGLQYRTSQTNGYGYVGVNPTEVPDIEVRRAIMYAIDTGDAVDYYDGKAKPVYRSMSLASWASPQYEDLYAIESYYDLYRDTQNYNTANGKNLSEKEYVLQMLAKADWKVGTDGKLSKDGKKLDLTFTIAGGSQDHPAFMMFNNAKTILEEWGFTVTVKNDVSALKKLATGQLAVWAAAWSSTIDPDMYQVYHMDSNASSTLNWGYKTILNDSTTQFEEEKLIIDELSQYIDDARKTLNKETRASLYALALDKVMELAVELPTYQRDDCTIFSMNVIDVDSLNASPTAFSGVIDKIWELRYNPDLKA